MQPSANNLPITVFLVPIYNIYVFLFCYAVSSSPVDSVGIDVTDNRDDPNNNQGSDIEEEGDSLNMSRSSKRGWYMR